MNDSIVNTVVSAVSYFGQLNQNDTEMAVEFFKNFEWQAENSYRQLKYSQESGQVIEIYLDQEEGFNVTLELPNNKSIFGLAFTPEQTIASLSELSEDDVIEVIEVFMTGDKDKMLEWIDLRS